MTKTTQPDLEVGGAWRFWGRYSLGVPTQRVSFVRAVDRSDYFQGWFGFLRALAHVAATA